MSDAQQLIDRLKARQGGARGIGFAADSLRMVYACRDGKCGVFPEQLASESDWQKALASDSLTYQADGMDIVAVEGGKLQTKTAKKLSKTEGAQLDFEATVTTTRRDRHGDILESMGGRLDAKSPLLWQHIPFQPNGKLVRQTLQNKSRINAHLAIIDRPFADDAAALVEFNALRISHGFSPTEWEELDEEDDVGFRVTSFDIMEVSLVSVPANPDAEIVDILVSKQSRKQFASPQVRLFAQAMWNSKPRAVVGGFEKSEDADAMPEVLKPMAGEHACRLRDPGDFEKDSFRSMERKHEDKTYRVIMGKLTGGNGSMVEQSYRYPKAEWDAAAAKSHCAGHDGMMFEPAAGEESGEPEAVKSGCRCGGKQTESDRFVDAEKKIAEQAAAIEQAEKTIATFRGQDANQIAANLIGHLMGGEELSLPLLGALDEVIEEAKSTFEARCLEEFV